jgi:hypothetical protein
MSGVGGLVAFGDDQNDHNLCHNQSVSCLKHAQRVASFTSCNRIKNGSSPGHPAQRGTYQPSSERAAVVSGRRVVVRDVG